MKGGKYPGLEREQNQQYQNYPHLQVLEPTNSIRNSEQLSTEQGPPSSLMTDTILAFAYRDDVWSQCLLIAPSRRQKQGNLGGLYRLNYTSGYELRPLHLPERAT